MTAWLCGGQGFESPQLHPSEQGLFSSRPESTVSLVAIVVAAQILLLGAEAEEEEHAATLGSGSRRVRRRAHLTPLRTIARACGDGTVWPRELPEAHGTAGPRMAELQCPVHTGRLGVSLWDRGARRGPGPSRA